MLLFHTNVAVCICNQDYFCIAHYIFYFLFFLNDYICCLCLYKSDHVYGYIHTKVE